LAGRKLRKPLASYWPVYSVCFGVWVSGSLWLLLHYFFVRQTDFGLTHNPLEHWSLVAHGALAFATLWLLGFLWGTHIVKRWRLRRHRKTGGVLFVVMGVLVLTGYLLYYVSGDQTRDVTAYVHWILGLAMPLSLLAHWLIRRQ
jgi:hypothetical protein